MISQTTESVETVLNSWRSKVRVEDGISNIRINEHMRRFSGDVILELVLKAITQKGE